MICANCGTANEPGRKFCGECGNRLALACASCGASNPAATKFCGECGTPLAGAATAETPGDEARAEPVAERRLVSVLFADLVGFTTLSEQRDAEEVRELLTRYFDTCRALVARYGGSIEKFIGDAVMAVWGAPTTNEDDAERAVRAALDLTAAVAALGEEIGVPTLRARAGVLSGEAAVTIGATGQGMVAGDLVNTASRIQAAAPPGVVLVGAETKLATESAIDYEEAGSHKLKGKADPMTLWRAVRVVGLTGGTMRATEIEPPFTGRDPELRLLKELFHASADERRAHLVSVMGIGGIGKSRLVWEFEKYVDGLAQDVWWQRGRCLAYGDGVAFWALAEMVRGRAGIVEDEDSETAMPKLRTAVEQVITDPDERRFAEPRLAQLLGLEARATGDQENLFSAWRLFFERLSDSSPTIMVFEDLHWADAALVDFIEYLLDWGRDRPIFIVALARPELVERRPTWGAAKRGFTSLFLEPLGGEQIDALLQGAVTGLPDDLRRLILDRSEGIPFYAVETVRMLLDRGLIVRDGSAYRVTGTIDALEVPATLHALIAARLDGLQPDERRLLQDASVLGRTFTLPGIVAVSGVPEPEARALLDALVRKEILSLASDPLSAERGQYGFLQDLVKRVAYETMSKRDRRPRHLAAAGYLAGVAGAEDEDIVEVIAAHYVDAYHAWPEAPDADAVRLQARDALVRAGERAASLGANLGAQRQFERAAELSDDPITGAELIERAGLMAAAGSRTDEAGALFERARRAFEENGATHPAARVSARFAEIQWDLGRLGEGLERMDASFQVLATEKPDADLAALAAQVGRFAFFAGSHQLAEQRLEDALEAAEALGLPETLSQALNTKALLFSVQGRRREGFALLRYALDLAIEHDKPSAALRAYNNLADLSLQDDRFGDGEQYVNDGLQLARRVGNRYWEEVLVGQGIEPLYLLGDWDGARERMRLLEGLSGEGHSRTAFTQGYVAFGSAMLIARGELGEAARLIAEFAELESSADHQERLEHGTAAVLLANAHDQPDALETALRIWELRTSLGRDDARMKEVLVTAVEAALRIGDLTTATRLVDELQDRPRGLATIFGIAQGLRLRARLSATAGRREGVEDGWKGAIGLFREMATPFWTARTLLDQGEWLAAEGQSTDAEPVLTEARDIFERLQATAWVSRVEAVAARPSTPAA